jgi:hypothetical protein
LTVSREAGYNRKANTIEEVALAQKNYRLFGLNQAGKKVKHWFRATDHAEAAKAALAFARTRAGFRLSRLVHIPKKNEYLDVPLPETA